MVRKGKKCNLSSYFQSTSQLFQFQIATHVFCKDANISQFLIKMYFIYLPENKSCTPSIPLPALFVIDDGCDECRLGHQVWSLSVQTQRGVSVGLWSTPNCKCIHHEYKLCRYCKKILSFHITIPQGNYSTCFIHGKINWNKLAS